MESHISVQNLKCGGCANTISKRLKQLVDVSDVTIEVETGLVTFQHTDVATPEKVVHELSRLGYPIDTESNSLTSKVRSLVSCGIGRLSS